ncbi:MAG: aminotransferase class I/II-fold pyridoxal phosphate-dependent enzyme [Gammaproteobacteria bacterium]|nr:aminotransferase class I/II-fold pyridoxal phosphate-dependent enzyme [Gammaproteobacteria bacterium]MBU1647515.1 aminotransferase class I/II-fold pyridoxal phosphate-dependent enzyme [Gammaproteobacteria bacterium]MBU1972964.1 aminotransferase class I/II-fold pyridoxal phosphate-dependent enzyme [Gammaproteobacteria bacterium]
MIRRKSASPDVNLNLNVRGLKQSATLAINERSAELIRSGRQVYRLGLGQSPFPVPQPVVDELKANAHQKDYLPVRGLRALRDAVAGYHRRMHGIERSGDDVLIGPGSKELMFVLQLVYYGDLVIPTPSWVSYAPQARIVGRQIHWVPTSPENDWRLMPDDLDRACHDDPGRPRIVILNYPSNPTGDTYTSDELKALAKVAKKYKVILVSDEIYGELHHRGQHVSIARFYPEGTIISGGLSKWCGAGGWRLGTFTFPHSLRWLLDAMATVASETYTSTSAPIQYAAIRAFAGGTEMETYLAHSRRVLRHLGRHVWRSLRDAGASVSEPVGGFYLFPDFGPLRERLARHGVADSITLCERLLGDAGVATLPGSDFGRPPQELTLRLAYVDFDGARCLMAAQQIPLDQELDRAFLELYCPNVMQATAAMASWLKKLK